MRLLTADSTENLAARLINNFINAYNSTHEIPKWVVIVTENDIIDKIGYSEFGITETYGSIIDYIMAELEQAAKTMIKDIPFKAKKYLWPKFLWIEPTLHNCYQDNTLRMKFIKSLHRASITHESTIVLPLKQGWSVTNADLYKWHRQVFTFRGYQALWMAIDHTIKFADVKLMRDFGLKFDKIFNKPKATVDADERMDNYVKNKNNKSRLQALTTMNARLCNRRIITSRDRRLQELSQNIVGDSSSNENLRRRPSDNKSAKKQLFKY